MSAQLDSPKPNAPHQALGILCLFTTQKEGLTGLHLCSLFFSPNQIKSPEDRIQNSMATGKIFLVFKSSESQRKALHALAVSNLPTENQLHLQPNTFKRVSTNKAPPKHGPPPAVALQRQKMISLVHHGKLSAKHRDETLRQCLLNK